MVHEANLALFNSVLQNHKQFSYSPIMVITFTSKTKFIVDFENNIRFLSNILGLWNLKNLREHCCRHSEGESITIGRECNHV